MAAITLLLTLYLIPVLVVAQDISHPTPESPGPPVISQDMQDTISVRGKGRPVDASGRLLHGPGSIEYNCLKVWKAHHKANAELRYEDFMARCRG